MLVTQRVSAFIRYICPMFNETMFYTLPPEVRVPTMIEREYAERNKEAMTMSQRRDIFLEIFAKYYDEEDGYDPDYLFSIMYPVRLH